MKQELPLGDDDAPIWLSGSFYVRRPGLDGALEWMRERIQAGNPACGDPDGYSEPITATWLHRIAAAIRRDDAMVMKADQFPRLQP